VRFGHDFFRIGVERHCGAPGSGFQKPGIMEMQSGRKYPLGVGHPLIGLTCSDMQIDLCGLS
jgi:hypothetical protein